MDIQTLEEGQYFHIYNWGVNLEDIFKEQRNYYYFFQQYIAYCSDVFETCYYGLLKNHFHLLVYVNENVDVPKSNGREQYGSTHRNNYRIFLIPIPSLLIRLVSAQGVYLNRLLKGN